MHFTPQRTTKRVLVRREYGCATPSERFMNYLDPSQEASLVAAARNGSNDAAGEIFDRHGAALLHVACSVLRDSDRAEAVVADIVVKICTEPTSPSRPASLRRELTSLTYLRCAQQLPSFAKRSGATMDRGGVLVRMTELRQLAGQRRAAIALMTVGDHTYLNVARLFRLSPATVLELLHSCFLHTSHPYYPAWRWQTSSLPCCSDPVL